MSQILSYWSVLIWAVPLLILCFIALHLFGWRVALLVSFVSGSIIIFLLGRKIERDSYRKQVQDIKEKRRKAYEKIDNRNTGPVDVLDRLRRGKF